MNQKSSNTGVINIHGREYQTVALRITTFRQSHPFHSLTTEIVTRDEEWVVMRATVSDPDGRVIATGHAEERRTASQINKTSALENCETSAIGRALAAFGIGGTEFASADEVANAIHQQATPHVAESKPVLPSDRAWAIRNCKTVQALDELVDKWRKDGLSGNQEFIAALKNAIDERRAALEAKADRDAFVGEMEAQG